MILETEGIVLHSLRYGDKKVIVDMFTMKNGRQSFIVTIPKSSKAGIGKQLFQPLTILSITASSSRGQLHKITDAHVAVPYSSLPFDPFKLSISLFLAEFLYQSLKNEQANTPLYIYVKDSLLWLDVCDKSVSNFHIVFMLRLAQFIGFAPNTDGYCDGDGFDLRACSFCHTAPLHNDHLVPSEAAMIRNVVRINYANMHLFRFTRAERNRLLDILVQYYCIHLPDFSPLKSLQVLRELF
ncbi:MAG: DNA repair protein RecO [Prevotella sp.]|nr:DNA repair protein RecO [Prevotella sp.]